MFCVLLCAACNGPPKPELHINGEVPASLYQRPAMPKPLPAKATQKDVARWAVGAWDALVQSVEKLDAIKAIQERAKKKRAEEK